MPVKPAPSPFIAKYWYEQFQRNSVAQASASLIASCLLIVGLFIFAIRPSFVTITNLQVQIEEMETLNTQLKAKLSLLKKLYPQYKKLEPLIPKVDQVLPTQHKFSTYETQLRVLVNSYNLKLSALSFTEFPLAGAVEAGLASGSGTPAKAAMTQASETSSITVSLNLEGEYTQIKRFLSALQTLVRITRLEKIQLIASNGAVAPMNLTLKGVIYYDPNQGSKGSL